ncbi:MAG: bifunctional serine/threonine-protein kinase/formylglycine-generating enzyme family protein [Acidobacteriota bacterium]
MKFCPRDGDVLEMDLTSLVGVNLDGQYHIEALIGKGGMGAVYRARHILLGDCVAIKILSQHLSESPESLRRFLREGQAARRFRHPNVVTVHDLRTSNEGMAYMVLEYIDGHTLTKELKRRGRFSALEAYQILKPIASALNAAHTMNIVHRDLKPDNIMIGQSSDGKPIVKLLDLGIAKVNEGFTAMTRNDQFLGTPYYMSPEHWGAVPNDSGLKIDARADIYSLGVVFYELIAGQLPFTGETIQEMATKHMLVPPPLLHKTVAGVSEAFSYTIARTMAKDRNDRPASCEELIRELREALNISVNGLTGPLYAIEVLDSDSELPTIKLLTNAADQAAYLTRPYTGLANLTRGPLAGYEFEVVTVNEQGEINQRRRVQADCFYEDLGAGIKLDMVLIPGGTFLMGSPASELKRSKDEGPQHQVSISPFFIAKFQITQVQWAAIANLPQVYRPLLSDPASFKGDSRPVENVSWEDCEEFCARLSQKTGRSYSLPSEAQWEYACRAGTQTPFHFGPTINSELANYNGILRYGEGPKGISRNSTIPVGSLGFANTYGLYDMHGNVWEWCADPWHDNYQDAPTDERIWQSGGDTTRRVIRGGSWYVNSTLCRAATRTGSWPNSKNDFLGFRVIALLA